MNTRTIKHQPDPSFPKNQVRTSRYNFLTWAPLSLIFQFKRINNIYFLIISILCLFSFSPKNPWTLIFTFALVLLFTMLKEGYEDIFRHRQDSETNNSPILKLDRSVCQFVNDKCQNIVPGDLVQVLKDQNIPADLLLISTSDSKGVAFVNTMNLDGETNLKEKKICLQVDMTQLNSLVFSIISELPSPDLYRWSATLETTEQVVPVNINNLLLRGSFLKNTEYVIGIAVFTGKDSKIVMNSKKPPFKVSNIQKKMNSILYTIFALQISVCVLFATTGGVWEEEESNSHVYLDLSGIPIGEGIVLRVFTFWIAYSHLIPISLYVTVEIVKLFLSWVIENDLEMYFEDSDQRAQARSSELVEELGQVSFVFTDKTGTLTNNDMVFSKMFTTGDEDWVLLAMAICNSVFPMSREDRIEYLASSPDELALVKAAEKMKVVLVSKEGKDVIVLVKGNEKKYQLIEDCPFDSDRKRMSVVVKDTDSGEVILLTKGADSVMFPLLEPSNYSDIKEKLSGFAREGLRTLVFSMKVLKNLEILSELQSEKLKLGQDLSKLWSAIESNSKFIAVTALEDRLQEGVADSLSFLLEASIKIWMLTGDKEETAIEIAKSCKLFKESSKILEVFTDHSIQTENLIEKIISENDSEDFSIAINGIALSYVLNNKILADKFFNFAVNAKSCVCCRVSPFQKAEVVRIGKKHTKGLTLAIGDGANDVNMIQEAHIGVGISGKEGSQAVLAADFALAQFAFLTHLLLHHGRLAYKRVSLFILYYFYKNFAAAFTELWFALFSAFSGQIYFLDWLPQLYNTFWTSWPCLTICSLEQDIPRDIVLENPYLYRVGINGGYFGVKRFWVWVLSAIFHSVICFFTPIIAFEKGVDQSGMAPWLWYTSLVSFILVIHVVNLKLLIESNFWNKYSVCSILIGIGLFYLMVVILNIPDVSHVLQPEIEYLLFEVLSNGKTWILILFAPFIAVVPDFLADCVRKVFIPTPVFLMLGKEKFRISLIQNNKI